MGTCYQHSVLVVASHTLPDLHTLPFAPRVSRVLSLRSSIGYQQHNSNQLLFGPSSKAQLNPKHYRTWSLLVFYWTCQVSIIACLFLAGILHVAEGHGHAIRHLVAAQLRRFRKRPGTNL